jgi:hypothetical protein
MVEWRTNSFEKPTLLVLFAGFRIAGFRIAGFGIAVSALHTYHLTAEAPSARNRRQGLFMVAG